MFLLTYLEVEEIASEKMATRERVAESIAVLDTQTTVLPPVTSGSPLAERVGASGPKPTVALNPLRTAP